MEPEGAILPEARINHFTLPTFRSKITYNLWNKNLTNFKIFPEMMVFNEREIIRKIRVMINSGLKYTKAKMQFDIKQVEQKRKILIIIFRQSDPELV
jgi:uncharacterized protein YjaG (DUF416 family)